MRLRGVNRRTRALFPLRVKPLPLIRVVVANTTPFVKVKAVVVVKVVVVKIKIKISVERVEPRTSVWTRRN